MPARGQTQAVFPRSIRRNCTSRPPAEPGRATFQVSLGVLASRRKCFTLPPLLDFR